MRILRDTTFLLALNLAPFLTAQTFPADTILTDPVLNVVEKTVIVPIYLWQRFSYSADFMNCQFEPSCSNYMAQAIAEYGVLPGVIRGTDRIVRCNPAARHYHSLQLQPQYAADGRLLEPINWQPGRTTEKDPKLALALSVVPGLGRTYAGRPMDGLFSFLMVIGFGSNAYYFQQDQNPTAAALTGIAATLFWVADFYGAYRAGQRAP